ncbi:MAG: hypothetical protein Q4B06_02195 [Candidatus Saccharibacteria bacterium]|nr:hypothetical protein [Candidatus Saccharibacteria bacterium]
MSSVDEIEKHTIDMYRKLIQGTISRQEADDYVCNVYHQYDADFEQFLASRYAYLYDLISALELAVTPDDKGVWLYDMVDFSD